MSRPIEYNGEVLAKAGEYLNSYEAEGDVVPSIEGLARFLDISRDTVYDWEKHAEKEAFSDIVRKVRNEQARTLINKGLSGVFNSPITKVMLTKHGYREGTDVGLSGEVKTGPSLTDEQYRNIVQLASERIANQGSSEEGATGI